MKSSLNKKALFVLLLAVSPARAERVTRARYVMGTVLEAQAEGPGAAAALTEAFEEVERWDRLLSLYKKDSELSRLNASAARAPFACSPDVWRVLNAAFAASRATERRFDPTILPVLRRGPEALPLVGLELVRFDAEARAVSFNKEGVGLTLDAYAKGWALDEAAARLRVRGVPALLNFGGQILAVGVPAGERGWRVAVPGRPEALLLADASASTSGNSEQPGHIVDPRSGAKIVERPSVTVIAAAGADADAWSTALFAAGPSLKYEGCALTESTKEIASACRPFLAGKSKGALE